MKTDRSKPEKRLGFTPIGQLLGKVRKVFPNAEIIPAGDSEDLSKMTEQVTKVFPLRRKKSHAQKLEPPPESQPDLPLLIYENTD